MKPDIYRELASNMPKLARGEGSNTGMYWERAADRERHPLMVVMSSFPPYVYELAERDYPNKRIAASRSHEAILAAERLYHVGREV